MGLMGLKGAGSGKAQGKTLKKPTGWQKSHKQGVSKQKPGLSKLGIPNRYLLRHPGKLRKTKKA